MSTLSKLLLAISLTALSACSQTHYVTDGLSVQSRATTSTTTTTPTTTANYTSYLLASINEGQLISNLAAGTWLDFINIQADPLAEYIKGASGSVPHWAPVQPGFYIVTVSIAFAPPQSSYSASGTFIPGTWPANSLVTLSIMRNDGSVLHTTVSPCIGTVTCQAQNTIAIAMRENATNRDSLAFNAIVTTSQPTITRAQLSQVSGYNAYNQLSIVRVTQ